MNEFGNKIINLQALDVQTLGHYCYNSYSQFSANRCFKRERCVRHYALEFFSKKTRRIGP